MSKLSKPMFDALTDLASYGIFQSGTRKQTIAGLVSRGLVELASDGDYHITNDGYTELGITKPVTLTAESVPLAEWEAELLGVDFTRPYVVQQYRNGIWFNLPGMSYRTWGTASVKRNQWQSRHKTTDYRVFDMIDNRVCA